MNALSVNVVPSVVPIDTIAMLKYRYCDVEIHLKNTRFYYSPLNIFQILLYKILGFDYIYGDEYVEIMSKRLNIKKELLYG